MANKGELKEKVSKVQIIRSNKLTVTEINALTSKILSDANVMIKKHNADVTIDPEFKSEVKKLKTKTGVLSAERALTFIKQRHKKVEFSVLSDDYDKQYKELLSSFKRKELGTWTDSSDFRIVKNELILSQVNNSNMFELAEAIAMKLTINA